jgi:hypothetical protein
VSLRLLRHESFIQRFEQLSKRDKSKILSSLQTVARMMDAEDIDAPPILDIALADR